MPISYLQPIFLFGVVVCVIVFLGLQQSAEWAKVMAEQENKNIELQPLKPESAPPEVKSHSIRPTVDKVRKS